MPDIRDLVDGIDDRWGRLDVLVNSAAIFPRTPWAEIDEATWDRTLDVNLKAPFFTAWHAAPLMQRNGGGKIINIADWAGLGPTRTTSRTYLQGRDHHDDEGDGAELAPSIAVNAIAPGPVMLPEDFDAAVAERIRKGYAARAAGEPTTSRRGVVYLVAMTDFVTGHVLVVDGGRLIA